MGKSAKTTQVGGSSIPKEFLPYYTNMFSQAQGAANQVSTQPYGGDFVAPADPWQVQGQNARYGAAMGLPDSAGQGLIQMGQDTLAGKYMSPESNPWLSGAVSAAQRPVTQNYQENTVGGINDAARKSGAFGGVRRDVVQNQAFRDYNKTIGDIGTNMFMANYAGERTNQMNAGNTINQGFQLNQMKPSLIEAAGSDRQALAQNAIDNQLAKFQDQVTAPFRGLNQMLPVLGLNVGMDSKNWSNTRSLMFGI